MIDKQRAIESAYLVPGWCWPRELDAIYDFCVGGRLHIEVGSFCGRSLLTAACAMGERGKVVVIDPLKLDEVKYSIPSVQWVQDVFSATVKAVKGFRPDVAIEHMPTPSTDAARTWKRPASSIYLDGEHTYAEVLADLEAWYPLVEHGGVFFGHDYCAAELGVIEAVEEFFGTRQLPVAVLPRTRIWWHRKPLSDDKSLSHLLS